MTRSLTGTFFILAFLPIFLLVLATFFVWNRFAKYDSSEAGERIWRQSLIGAILACALFAFCFAVGVWFSIARLKGQGWML